MISNIRFRLIKLEITKGNWKSFRVRTDEQLKELIKKYDPKNCYWSISTYLNPKRVEHPKSLVDSIILDSYIFIDFDSINAKEEALKTTKLMKDYNLYSILDSGRGVHLYYEHKTKDFKKEKKEVSDFLKKHKINCDYPALEDIFRIARIFLSHNGNRNKQTKLLSYSQLRKLAEVEKPMTNKTNSKTSRDLGLPAHPISFSGEYLNTRVKKSIKNQILFLKYKDLDIAKRDINNLNLKCNTYFFDYNDFIGVLTLKCFHINKLRKIVRRSRAMNKASLLKFKSQYLRLSELMRDDGEILKKEPKYIATNKSAVKNPYFASASIVPFLSYHKVDLSSEYDNLLIGAVDHKIYNSTWR